MPKFVTLTIPQLKEILRAHELSTNGNKSELVTRLAQELQTDEIDEVSLNNILNVDERNIQIQIAELKSMITSITMSVKDTTDKLNALTEKSDNEERIEENNDNDSDQASVQMVPLQSELVTDNANTQRLFAKYSIKEIAETIPEFDPTNEQSLNAEQFIEHVQSAMSAYDFEAKCVLLAVYSRLKGVSRLWLDSQPVFSSWAEFRKALLDEFGMQLNEAEINAKMTKATRRDGERMDDYCFKMNALGKRYHISEPAIIKYTRDGLRNRDVQTAIATTKFNTMKELRDTLTEYMINVPKSSKHLNENVYNRNTGIKTDKFIVKREFNHTNNFECYNCHGNGHMSINCPHPQRKERCTICKKTNHKTENCFKRENNDPTKNTVHKIIDNDATYQDVVKRVAIGGHLLNVFMDSGSSTSLIRKTTAEIFDTPQSCYKELTGFAGGKYVSTSMIKTVITIDDHEHEIELFIVNDCDIPERVLLGRDILCRKGNRFIIDNDGCRVQSVNAIADRDDLEPENKTKLNELIKENRKCFASTVAEIGKSSTIKFSITLTTDEPVNLKAYRIPFAKRDIVREIIEDLLKHDIIRLSISNYASPIVLVAKKNNEHRLCVDYRSLNKITIKTPYPMPILEEQFSQLAKNNYFISLDLRMGYYQIEIEEGSKHYTAFVTTDGHFEFNRMPFGLVNAPAFFQRLMNSVLAEMEPFEAFAYLDDVVIVCKTIEEGFHRLNKMFALLTKHGLTLRLDKCQFFKDKLQYLGHEISKHGIKPGQLKIKAIKEFPVPKSVTEVRRFLGLTGFFRKFVEDYSLITNPITQLLKKNEQDNFRWSIEQQAAFEKLINILTNAPLLQLYDVHEYHEIHTDACSIGLAGVLLQSRNEIDWKPVMYFSRHCTEAERKYHSYELEVLAVVETIERFRLYLLGTHFRIVTDCAAIAATKDKCELKPRISRWWMKMQEYDFEIIHRSGNRLAHVDAMSRSPVDSSSTVEPAGFVMNIHEEEEKDWIAALQQRDERIKLIVAVLKNNIISPEEPQIKRDYEILHDRLYRKQQNDRKLVVPKLVRMTIVKHYHDDMGHFAADKTLKRISKLFWFPKMRKMVNEYIKSCIACCYNKAQRSKPEAEMHFEPPIPIPFRTLHLDHLGPFVRSSKGNTHLLAVSDAFTKFCILKAVRNTKTTPVLTALMEIIGYFGLPAKLITDRGTAFTAKAFEKFCNDHNIKHIKTAVRTPRSNGQVERLNATILDAIRTSQNSKTWDATLNQLQWVINSQQNSTTKFSPNELIFNFNINDAVHNHLVAAISNETATDSENNANSKRENALLNITKERNKWKTRFDRRHAQPTIYHNGDLVVIKTEPVSTGESRKMEAKFRGPYVIAKVLGNDRYVIADVPGAQLKSRPFNSVYASDHIKPWCDGYPELVYADSGDESSEHNTDDDTDEQLASVATHESVRTTECQEGPSCHTQP